MGKNKKNRNKNKQAPTDQALPKKKPATPSYPVIQPRLNVLLCCSVALAAIFLYSGAFGHQFAFDDAAVIQENRFVQKGFGGINDILKTQYFEGFNSQTNARAYRPVSMVMYAIEYEFFGLNPKVYHAVNILLYALTAMVSLLALLRLLRNYHWALAFFTTLLFIAHPVHVDIVANVKSRDELLGFLNFCIGLLFLLKDLDDPKWWKKLISYAFFFLALASKETLLTTVACIPLLLYFFRDFRTSKIVRISLPYLGLFIIFLLVRASVLSAADESRSPITFLDNPILAAKNLNESIGTTIYCMGLYLQTLFFPYKLSCDYSYNSISLREMNDPIVIAWLLAYLFLIIIAIKGFRKKNIFSFCILWFFITISIVSNIFILSSNGYADRFLYTPSLSFCLALAFGLYKLAGFQPGQPILSSFTVGTSVSVVLLLAILTLFSIKTISYVPVWKDQMTLYAYNLTIHPQNARMQKNYGSEMVRQAMFIRYDSTLRKPADTAAINALARQGLTELQKANAIYPIGVLEHTQAGNAFIMLKNYTEAEKSFLTAVRINSTNRYALTGLGIVYYNTGRFKEAAETWEKISHELRTAGDNYNLYIAYQKLGDQQKANYYKQLSGR
jgi:protein O-mannosyl-transferase